MKKWLREKKRDPNPNARPPARYKGSRVEMVKAWRATFESPETGFPSLRGSTKKRGRYTSEEPLTAAIKHWYVDYIHYMPGAEWDTLYGQPQR